MESGLLDPAAVESIFAEHRGGQADHGRALFAITMFSCWWMDQSAGIRDKPAVGG
jgi:hypothetical protein